MAHSPHRASRGFSLREVPKHLREMESIAVKERETLFFGRDFDLFVLQHSQERPLLDRLTLEDVGACLVEPRMWVPEHGAVGGHRR